MIYQDEKAHEKNAKSGNERTLTTHQTFNREYSSSHTFYTFQFQDIKRFERAV